MSNDTQFSAPVGVGDTFRTLAVAGGKKWPVSTLGWVTHYSTDNGVSDPNVIQDVDATHGMPVAVVGSVPVTGTFWQTTQPVSAASLPLPAGAATAANQATEITGLAAILSALGGTLTVSAGSLPLPAGAATAALQGTGNTSLASILAALQGTIAVSGTFWQTTQPVSGTVTAANTAGVAAEDAAVSGNPVLHGLQAQRARRTAVGADGRVVRATGDRYGRTQTVGVDLTALALQVTASGDTDLIAAPSVGSRLKLLRVEASNSHATTALVVGLKSASLNSGAVFGKKYLPAAGGQAVWTFPGGHLTCGDAEKLVANLSAGGTVEVTCYYETIAS